MHRPNSKPTTVTNNKLRYLFLLKHVWNRDFNAFAVVSARATCCNNEKLGNLTTEYTDAFRTIR